MERLDAVVIGAGVVGLAVARALALAGREVTVLRRGALCADDARMDKQQQRDEAEHDGADRRDHAAENTLAHETARTQTHQRDTECNPARHDL